MTKISSKRTLTDYGKVQVLISDIIRNKKIFMNTDKIKQYNYLDIGCGPHMSNDFINLDYQWRKGIDICWDLTKKDLPLDSNSIEGVFTEHCFEHIPFESFEQNMREIYRVLKKDCIMRLIMPDGELYVDLYVERRNGSKKLMPYESDETRTSMQSINQIFRGHGHLFIYDFETIKIILERVGFKNIVKQQYRFGQNDKLIKDTPHRSVESLYVEATK